MLFEFTVPEGDYDYNFSTMKYDWKDLVFVEKKKEALKTIAEYIKDEVPFTLVVTLKGKKNNA